MNHVANDETMKKAGFYPWLICGLGALFYCYEYLLRISPSVMTGDLMRTYGITAGALGSLVAFYYHAYTPMQLPVGMLMDRFGPRRLLAMASLVCALGTYLFACSNQYHIAAVGRFLVGFGSAFAFVGVLKLATIWLPPQRFAMISGMATALGMVGAMIGDNVLDRLVNINGWQHTTMVSALIGLVLAAIIWLLVRDQGQQQSTVEQPTVEVHTLKELFTALLKLLRQPQVWLNGLIGCLMYLPTSAFAELWGIPYLKDAYYFNSQDAAGAISMIFLGWAIGAPLAGLFSDRIRRRRLPIILGSLVAAALITILLYVPDISRELVYVILLIFGIFSSAQVIVFAVGREISPARLSGTAIALTNMLVMLGGVIFQPVIGILLDRHWSGLSIQGVHIYTEADFRSALIILPVGLLITAFLSLFIKETYGMVQES